MRPMLLAGVLLIILGVVALAYQGITYTTREEVVDIGPIEVTAEDTERIPLPPIIGAIALAGGVFLTMAGLKKPVTG